MFDNQFPSFGSLNPMSESQKRISELDFNEILKCHLFILIGYFHSNDSHQCPILAVDFVIFYFGTENEEAIQAGAGSEWGIEIGCSFSVP